MYTIELTRGMGWDAPVVEVHTVKPTIHIVDVERRAQGLLDAVWVGSARERPTDYRIRDRSAAAYGRASAPRRPGP